MNKRIFKIFVSCLIIISIISTFCIAFAWTDKQNKAHEIADMARSIGLAEDNPIIKETSRIWWEEQKATQPQQQTQTQQNTNTPTENKRYVGTYKITGYDSCYACNGNSTGITASGTRLTVGRTVAANRNDFAFGTKLYIEGVGYRTVEDRGVSSGTIDVLCNNHSECYRITGSYKVYVVE